MIRAVCLMAVLLIVGVGLVMAHWEEMGKRNTAFAKECNDRGGVAGFESGILQCMGASAPVARKDP